MTEKAPVKRIQPEVIDDKRYEKVPVQKATKTKKVAVDSQIIDAAITERYPRSEQSENYRAEVIAPMAGIPMLRLAPVGWVGAAPLQIPESRIDEVIQLLTKMR